MFKDFYHSFYYCLLITASIVSMIAVVKADKTFKWICYLVIITLMSELTAKYVSFSLLKSNNIVYHIFTPIEYALYAVIYKMFFESKKWNAFLFLSAAGLAVLEILNTLFFQPIRVTNTNVMITESVLLVFLSLGLFIKIREAPIYENILNEGIFWFNSTVLIYYSFNILIWGFHNIKVYQMKNPPSVIYEINLLFSGALYAVYAAAILLNAISNRRVVKRL